LSDGRLLLLALTVVAVASFVSLSIFGYADRGRANRRTDWRLLAVVCGAFGLWAAHFVGGPETAMASGPLQLILAAVAAGTVLVVLLLGVLSMLIDRRMMRESVHNMQQLVDAAIEGIAVAKNDRIVSVNQRLAELCSVPRAELIGKSLAGDLIDTPIDTAGEALLRTASGAPIPVNVVRRRLSVGDDVYTIHDLTERRAVEMELQRQNRALQEQEEELRSRNLLLDTALMHMSQGLCMYDKDQRVVVCNERYPRSIG
jgi:PAS domain-containing protein